MTNEKMEEIINKARQSAVSISGSKWEVYVLNFLKESLKNVSNNSKDERIKRISSDIGVVRMGQIKGINTAKKKYPKLYKSLFIPIINFARNRQYLISQEGILDLIFESGAMGDTDIVVFSKKYQIPIAIVSCKISLHGRLTETLFYSLYFRITNRVRVVLATADKGKQKEKDKWETEWGSPEKPSKNRLLATLFLDGVYVDNTPTFMPPSFNPSKDKTIIGGIVRPINELPYDIIRWYEDIKFSVNQPTTKN